MPYSIRSFVTNKGVRRFKRQWRIWLGGWMVAIMILAAILAPVVAPYPPNQMNILNMLAPPSAHHWLGTDNYGRDVLTRLLYGSQVSLLVGFSSVVIAGGIGTTLGLLAGYYRGVVDTLIMRVSDIVLSFPVILLALALVAVLGPSVRDVIVALGLSYWATYARIVRAATMEVLTEPYVEAAQAAGASHGHIMTRHVLRSILGPILVMATLGVGAAIVAEASLSFLGLGVQPPTPSWGDMMAAGLHYLSQDPLLSTDAGLAIMWTVLGFNLLGDGLSDHWNPRARYGSPRS